MTDLRAVRIVISDELFRHHIESLVPFFKIGLVPLDMRICMPDGTEMGDKKISFWKSSDPLGYLYEFIFWWHRFPVVIHGRQIPQATVEVTDQEDMLRFVFCLSTGERIEQWVTKEGRAIGQTNPMR